MLTIERWYILDILIDGQRPLNEVYREYCLIVASSDGENFAGDVLALSEAGFLQGGHLPPDADQSLELSLAQVSQLSQADILSQSHIWSSETNHQDEFSVSDLWLTLTPLGQTEWEAPDYEPYWHPKVSSPKVLNQTDRLALGVMMGVAAFALLALAGWGILDGSWSYGTDCRVNLASELQPLQATLTAASVSPAIVHRLELAALPNLWASRAYELLIEADELLEPASNDPAIEAARSRLQSVTGHIYPYNYCYTLRR